jgi:hypothetical protein
VNRTARVPQEGPPGVRPGLLRNREFETKPDGRKQRRTEIIGRSQTPLTPKRENLRGLAEYCGTSVQMIEQTYGRFMRKEFLGPLIGARPESPRSSGWRKNRDPPKGSREKGPNFMENFGGGGGIRTRAKMTRKYRLYSQSAR